MKIYLDDERKTPDGWTRTRTVEETIELLKTNRVESISLDHDLGTEKDGHDVLVWIEEQTALHGFVPPDEIMVHSANTAARPEMEAAIQSIRRFYASRRQD